MSQLWTVVSGMSVWTTFRTRHRKIATTWQKCNFQQKFVTHFTCVDHKSIWSILVPCFIASWFVATSRLQMLTVASKYVYSKYVMWFAGNGHFECVAIFSVLYPSMYGLVVCCNLCQQKEQMIETWMISSTTENTHKMVIKTLEFKAIVVYLFTNVIELILYGRKTCFKFVNFSRVLNRAIFPILDSDKIPNPGVFGHNKKCGRQTPYGFIRVAIVQIQIFMPFWG